MEHHLNTPFSYFSAVLWEGIQFHLEHPFESTNADSTAPPPPHSLDLRGRPPRTELRMKRKRDRDIVCWYILRSNNSSTNRQYVFDAAIFETKIFQSPG
ncbi:hypothetical protein CEXT_465291 [Caerostris extrusa]|uniref:Uncharacterized protein n=1 Tax=Caerostris extrusa TaxID=172846 RepID=A0AAV4PE64_CAEEX|nr:hypothetical protein CEXT_465291 [Caerostris extrusa]